MRRIILPLILAVLALPVMASAHGHDWPRVPGADSCRSRGGIPILVEPITVYPPGFQQVAPRFFRREGSRTQLPVQFEAMVSAWWVDGPPGTNRYIVDESVSTELVDMQHGEGDEWVAPVYNVKDMGLGTRRVLPDGRKVNVLQLMVCSWTEAEMLRRLWRP